MSSPRGAFDTGIRRPAQRREGARLARLERAARRRKRRQRLLLGALTMLLGAVMSAVPALLLHERQARQTADAAPEALKGADAESAAARQQRLLLVTSEEPDGPASSVTLLAGPTADTPASALFLPTSTLVSTPGFGLDQLAAAHRYGGAELVRATVENALSVRIDEVATATAPAFAEFLGRAGELEVDLPERVVERAADGSATVRFERGAQTMGGDELAGLWLHGSGDDEELQALDRRRLVLEEVLSAASDEQVRGRLVGDGAPQLRTEAESAWLRDLFGDLAEAQADDAVRYNLLPVERFGSAGSDGRRAYRIHEEDTARLVRGLLGGEQDVGAHSAARVQVLNGVGTPGIGQLVDRLLPDDVRLVLTGNANRFDYGQSRLVVYEESEEAVALAERVRERLGVGTIQVSRQPQSIVDLTVVVGNDLIEAQAADEDPTDDGSESTD